MFDPTVMWLNLFNFDFMRAYFFKNGIRLKNLYQHETKSQFLMNALKRVIMETDLSLIVVQCIVPENVSILFLHQWHQSNLLHQTFWPECYNVTVFFYMDWPLNAGTCFRVYIIKSSISFCWTKHFSFIEIVKAQCRMHCLSNIYLSVCRLDRIMWSMQTCR